MRACSRPQRLGRLGVGALLVVAACSPAAGRVVRGSRAAGASSTVTGPIQGGTVPRAGNEVLISNFTFTPATLAIRSGEKVRWVNVDAVAHTVDLSGVVSSVLIRGDTYTQTFAAAGTYSYTCSIHPFMHGTIVVSR